jgi:acetyl esterase/lipase
MMMRRFALQERGIAAERIVMVGHSAGATLVLGLLMRMRQRGVPHSFAFIDLLPEAAQCRAQITQFAAHVLGRARSQARGAVAVTAEP